MDFYESNLCVTVKRHALTFMHWKYWCTGSQGPPGFGYGPSAVLVWLSWPVSSGQWFPTNGHCPGRDVKCVITKSPVDGVCSERHRICHILRV